MAVNSQHVLAGIVSWGYKCAEVLWIEMYSFWVLIYGFVFRLSCLVFIQRLLFTGIGWIAILLGMEEAYFVQHSLSWKITK